MIKAKAPSPGTLNNGRINLPNTFPKNGITFVWLNNSVAIKKGSKLGSTEFAHKEIPDFVACKLELENTNKQIVNKVKIIGNSKFLNLITKIFFT